MSRLATPTDNPNTERFVRTLKQATIYGVVYDNINPANKATQDWLDFYNQTRPHQALRYLSPSDKAKEDNQPLLKPRQNKC